ncbi:MAG: class I SAM-dependent methyltransferase [Kiritimatiellae bacterium]|nr:class I SAM-dependent methyltransferase [Kiritimatiellia bacterium]
MTQLSPDAEDRFHALLQSFPTLSDAERAYVQRAGRRGWRTLAHLPHGSPDQKILDVGSMRGLFAPTYVEIWGYGEVHLLGYDVGKEAVLRRPGSNGREHEFRTASCNIELQPWPYPDHTFDTIVCMEVLEHLVFDPVFAMNEMCRVLKDGGRALVSVPNAASDECLSYIVNDMQPGFLRHYIADALESGARDINTIYNLGHFHEYTRTEFESLARATGFHIPQMIGVKPAAPVLNSFRFKMLRRFVHALFPHARRIREPLMVALLHKRHFIPLDQLPDRYPAPLYGRLAR